MLFLGVCSLVVGLSLGTTQFYQLAYALFGLCGASLALGVAGSRALGVKRRMSHNAGITAGESVNVGLRLTNGSRIAGSGVEVEDRLPHRHVSRLPSVPGMGESHLETTVSFPRRGLYGIGPVRVSSTDPLGLLRFRRDYGLAAELLVYPEIHDVPGLPVRSGGEGGGGPRPMSRSEEFSGLRDYRPGDDRRFVHWKSVARTGKMVIKEFDPDAPRRFSVVLDLPSSHNFAAQELEDAVSAAASVISHLDEARLAYRLILTDRDASATGFGSGKGPGGDGPYHAAMRLLAAARPDGETGIGDALREEASEGSLGDVMILITPGAPEDERHQSLAGSLRELSAFGVAAIVILTAPHTYAPPKPGAWGEERLSGLVGEIESTGAAVRVLRRETGVAGLTGLTPERARERVSDG